jgi:trans-aconitate methyltransferase
VIGVTEDRAAHWESVYTRNQTDGVSWFQSVPVISLELMDALGIAADSSLVDVGGGASVLVDVLLRKGFTDLTVLDVSDSALRASRARVGVDAPVTWIAHDLLTWKPTRPYDLWHDRAVFHFMSGSEIEVYQDLVKQSVAPGGSIIMATFAPNGPEWCSGLPVTRYSASQLSAVLGSGFTMVEERREVHTTPGGATQPFTWIAARRELD